MPGRLTRAAVAFAITAVAYQAYVVAVAPLVEPAGAVVRQAEALSLADLQRPPASLLNYRELLAAYFAPDHWCFQHPPAIVENDQAMVVVDLGRKYAQSESGELRVPRCALVFFPQPRDRTAPPPRDAIILEPSQGATLQMDQRLGNGMGGLGRMQFGQLLGDIIIRSDMDLPGPDDDLLIETRDVYMNEDVLQTPERVEFRLGEHRGRGRGLEIRFIPTESGSKSAPVTLFGKLESLEVSQQAAAQIAPGGLSLFGEPTDESRNKAREEFADAPATINSDGPFRIDFANRVASFVDNVQVRQLHPTGKLDRLTCQELILYFAEMRQWGGEDASGAGARQPEHTSLFGSINLQPATIEARGAPDRLVELDAPSQDAAARCERLTIELIARQVTLAGSDDVALLYRGAEIHAPSVRYELPPKDSAARLGAMAARGGGWLRVAPDPSRPSDELDVRWTDAMQLIRRGGQPVLVLDGRPRVTLASLGRLWSDQLELYLREAPNDAGASAASDRRPSASVDRIVGKGHVDIQSTEVVGRVNKLDVKLLYAAETAGVAPSGGAGAMSAAPFSGGPRARRTYHIDAAALEIDAVVRGRRAEAAAIRVEGDVSFRQAGLLPGADPSLQIVAERLRVSAANTTNAKIEIQGAGPGAIGDGGLPAGLAEISAGGATLRAPAFTIYQGASQATIDSPGELQMLVNRDFAGNALGEPQRMSITWRDSMRLDGDRITFRGNVYVAHAQGWLRTPRLTAVLTAPLRFDGAGARREPELAQLECWGGAIAEFDQRDNAGDVTAHQRIEMRSPQQETRSLSVNQVTGEILGDGPGRVDSVHYSDGAESLLNPLGTSASRTLARNASTADNSKRQLRRLTIDFVRGVHGNLHARWIQLYGNVQTVYGPIARRDESLEMTPGGRPGPDAVWITCDSLKVAENPLARIESAQRGGQKERFGQVELTAETSVVIEVEHPERGAITARGHRATYDQTKSLFVLEWDGRSLASITVQEYPGAPPSETSARKIFFRQDTGAWTLDGPSMIQLNQFDQFDTANK